MGTCECGSSCCARQVAPKIGSIGAPLASNFMQERRPRGAYVSMGIDFIPSEGG
jgi:hypothetical protein